MKEQLMDAFTRKFELHFITCKAKVKFYLIVLPNQLFDP